MNVNTTNLHILVAQKLTYKINFEHENFKVRIPFALISKKIWTNALEVLKENQTWYS